MAKQGGGNKRRRGSDHRMVGRKPVPTLRAKRARNGKAKKKVLTALYDVVSAGEVVYVGITSRPKARFNAHKTRGLIPKDAEMVVVEWYDERAKAEAAEYRRIQDKSPRFNKAMHPETRLQKLRRENHERDKAEARDMRRRWKEWTRIEYAKLGQEPPPMWWEAAGIDLD